MPEQPFYVDPGVGLLIRDVGVSVARALQRADLPADLFARQSAALDAARYFRLWDAVADEADDDTLPIRLAQAISAETFSPPIFAALCSTNLDEAAERIRTYKPLIGPTRFSVTRDVTSTSIEFAWGPLRPPASFTLTELAFWVRLARLGTRCEIRPLRVVSRTPPADQSAFVSFFGTGIDAGPTDRITFAASDARRTFLTHDEGMWSFFEPGLRRRLDDMTVAESTADRVEAALLQLLPAGSSSIGAVARTLAMSTRSLQRRLTDEGNSFQSVLAATRERLARHYLSDGTMPATEIAFLLGYADASSFYRAFRDWTGTTPERFRAGARPVTRAADAVRRRRRVPTAAPAMSSGSTRSS